MNKIIHRTLRPLTIPSAFTNIPITIKIVIAPNRPYTTKILGAQSDPLSPRLTVIAPVSSRTSSPKLSEFDTESRVPTPGRSQFARDPQNRFRPIARLTVSLEKSKTGRVNRPRACEIAQRRRRTNQEGFRAQDRRSTSSSEPGCDRAEVLGDQSRTRSTKAAWHRWQHDSTKDGCRPSSSAPWHPLCFRPAGGEGWRGGQPQLASAAGGGSFPFPVSAATPPLLVLRAPGAGGRGWHVYFPQCVRQRLSPC